jgi:hypothetical protein
MRCVLLLSGVSPTLTLWPPKPMPIQPILRGDTPGVSRLKVLSPLTLEDHRGQPGNVFRYLGMRLEAVP